jgi:hypothetical protein
MVRRVVPALLLALSVSACSAEPVTEALAPSTSASTVVSPSASETTGPSGGTAEGRPAIVVRTPRPGDELVSPLRIAGSADVFEATVSIRLLDANGQELAATFATATCGSGCRGRFSAELSFFTPERQLGAIEVFESSAEDGSALHLVSIPVVLAPGS